MIWFPCKQCGKTHGRPDTSAGTLVFCECGQGNTVPWDSTIPEPMAQAPPALLPAVPELAPLSFEPTKSATRPDSAAAYPLEDELSPRRRSRSEKRDPDYCFNHQHIPRAASCDDCEEAFCKDCVVKFQGANLCAPCKNFRARSLEVPASNTTLASASVVISLMTGLPLAFCLLPWGPQAGVSVLSLLALMPQILALGLGIRALYVAEKEAKFASQAMAITGVAAASLTCLFTVLLNWYASRTIV